MDEISQREYPPLGTTLLQLLTYLKKQKKIPMNISADILEISEWPQHLIPKEYRCSVCPASPLLSPPILITKHARVISMTGVVNSKFHT